jgi:RND superfamily putative drug exporter
MVAAIVPFMASGLVTVQQFAIGMAVVIILDALLVRPVLLPAAVALLGRWSWWPTSRSAPAVDRQSTRRMPAAPAANVPRHAGP